MKKFLILQVTIILLVGIIGNDSLFSIINSCMGICFNFLVSINNPIGFIFDIIYAVLNGILSIQTQVYATAFFMIVIQIPMAIYSYISWTRKKQISQSIMKSLNKKQMFIVSIFMILLSLIMYFVLQKLGSSNIIVDDFFFVVTVTSCLLLAFCYKSAYLITFFSGISGSILWLVQMINTGSGLSISVFYIIVTINAIIALFQQYNIKSVIYKTKKY